MNTVESGATFSPNRMYRYNLWRIWEPTKRKMIVIGLNPSTADERQDDPTIRRCINFAKREDCGGLFMLNLFAYRATDPIELYKQLELGRDFSVIVGLENDNYIDKYTTGQETPPLVVAAWGAHGDLGSRGNEVMANIARVDPQCFGLTKGGQPKHPLYLANAAPLHRVADLTAHRSWVRV